MGDASVHHLRKCPLGFWPAGPASMGGFVPPPKANFPKELIQASSTLVPQNSSPDKRIAPYREGEGRRWEGSAPWRDVPVSVILPVIEYNQTLNLVLEGLRRQTVPSVIYIIDTGSYLTTDQITALRGPSTEVLHIRTQGWFHPSCAVAAALDAAWGCVNTPYAFFTHDDCFLKKQTTFEELIPLCDKHKAAGHQITVREKSTTLLDFGHTFLMLNVKAMDQLPMSWSIRAYGHQTGVPTDPLLCKMGHPDTESMMNHQLHKAGLFPSFTPTSAQTCFTGTEENWKRNIDDWIDHCRSMTCGFLYANDHSQKAQQWVKLAMADATERMKQWK